MTRVMEHLKAQKETFAVSPFVTFLRDSSFSPQVRLRFLPSVAPLVMGSSELGASLRGEEPAPQQSFLESPHWAPFLKDLQALDLHSVANVNSMLQLLWGEDCGPVRETLYDIISLATDANPVRRQVLLLALEAVGNECLGALEQVAREFEASTRKQLSCIRSMRSLFDLRPLRDATVEMDLLPEMEQESLAIIDEVFAMTGHVADHLLDYVMRWFENQEKPSRPPSISDWIAAQSFQEFGFARIEALCRSSGFSSADTEKVQRYFDFMTKSWNTRLIGEASPWKSDISDDHTPFELSIALEADRPEIRFLIEAQNSPTSLQTSWDDGLAINERLNKELGVPLDSFNTVKDLFEPKNPEARFSLWHAFCLKPDGRAEIKVYLNPLARGPEHANTLVKEALARLGFANAWRFLSEVVMRRGALDQPLYFSLDLSGQAVSRVKIYVAHRDAAFEDIEAAMSLAKEYKQGEARAFCESIQGEFTAQRSTLTCWAFTSDDDDKPYSVTLHCPIRCYADNDRDALRRIRTVLDPKSHAVLDRTAWALANQTGRRLDEGVGLIQWASMRREGGAVRATFYLAAEAYGFVAPRNQATSWEYASEVPGAQVFQLSSAA
ncbi:tryptophan dimethylallyltransferase family protein [Hyalangium rubrum]|uniref:Tryptophan dimethylallyltransferase family protein n=1 Tax=Hyalangium rubrum TaxID=3103134 RepID=A0ABU5GUB5_9BACT|nr:tryptophan dimethylallyltransferase family protein [Hyalangium sp. s54d21]MDY7224777.1 tryptophan dimethylallyltransferase family protein [Hyalangium sp. s54d21]